MDDHLAEAAGHPELACRRAGCDQFVKIGATAAENEKVPLTRILAPLRPRCAACVADGVVTLPVSAQLPRGVVLAVIVPLRTGLPHPPA